MNSTRALGHPPVFPNPAYLQSSPVLHTYMYAVLPHPIIPLILPDGHEYHGMVSRWHVGQLLHPHGWWWSRSIVCNMAKVRSRLGSPRQRCPADGGGDLYPVSRPASRMSPTRCLIGPLSNVCMMGRLLFLKDRETCCSALCQPRSKYRS